MRTKSFWNNFYQVTLSQKIRKPNNVKKLKTSGSCYSGAPEFTPGLSGVRVTPEHLSSPPVLSKGNNKITELRTILQRESPNS